MAISMRGLAHHDIPAWLRLLAAIEAPDDLGERFSERDLADELDDPEVEPGEDLVGAWDGDRLVGFSGAVSRGETAGRMRLQGQGGVAPDRRGEGIGSALVAAMVARTDALHAARDPERPAVLFTPGLTSNTGQRDLFAGFGLLPDRWTFGMERTLEEVPEPPDTPAGYRVLSYRPGLDAAMLAAHNAAFAGTPSWATWSPERWRRWVTDSHNFRPALSLVAVTDDAPETVVAYVQTSEYDADFAATGVREAYVHKVGTVPGHRGRGLAGLLLRHCLAAYCHAGLQRASLDVDSANPTGALGIYERAGFTVRRRWTDYALERPPVTS